MIRRRMPVGAEFVAPGRLHVRVWAPGRRRAALVLDDRPAVALASAEGGYWEGEAEGVAPGARYRFRLDDGEPLPDPASRFQPEGPHGPSCVVDPDAFAWTDGAWKGFEADGPAVLYELHVGTFTPEGTWTAAAERLGELRETGIDAIQLLPVAEFAGRFGWGYDGVDLFAPTRLYGTPDEFRSFVDRAHALGTGVILDVVYNHFGPDGCYLGSFSRDYFTKRYVNEWGEAANYDGPQSGPVREFVVANAAYWIREYHLDGLRLDATQSIFDASPVHVVAEAVRAAREAAGARRLLLTAENEPQDPRLLRPAEAGGFGLDASWNDDFHHAARVALTGRREAYLHDYAGTPQELISALKWGYLYQGQHYAHQKKSRGGPLLDLGGRPFICFLENHDQVANHGGRRLWASASPAVLRAMTAVLLLGPGLPLLFQGQEDGASSPFLYFADHPPELAAAVRKGRAEFLSQFPSVASLDADVANPDPASAENFRRCVLDGAGRTEVRALHRDLLRLRRSEGAVRRRDPARLHGAVLGPSAFLLRYADPAADDRLLLVNLGADLALAIQPEPLLAPPAGASWELRWSSEAAAYGGRGALPWSAERTVVQGPAATLLGPARP